MMAEQNVIQAVMPGEEDGLGVEAMIARSYERYYATGLYDRRYPKHNARSMAAILEVGGKARSILDFGCGDGRYTLPLLHTTQAHVYGYDICPMGLSGLKTRLTNENQLDRVTLVQGPVDDYTQGNPIDLAIIMFGVLGHVAGRANRIAILRRIRTLLQVEGEGRLVISVPNANRRFRTEQREHDALRIAGTPEKPALEAGDILYARDNDGERIELFYHLFTPETLSAELREAGFGDIVMRVESVLSESAVTRSRLCAAADALLYPVTPLALGYGILATARA
ncbi:MAG: class I SAM-dependent methyltransferase [Alphaproteobacteria bacterium]|nr:class I SAM-dependent methyltransferase [Alphaproteobacteria bacterium]MBU1812829.1 class I SAM-dependent methyltransferase [Alphaproteobacteria bacterium]